MGVGEDVNPYLKISLSEARRPERAHRREEGKCTPTAHCAWVGSHPTFPGGALSAGSPQNPVVSTPKDFPSDLTLPALGSGSPAHIPPLDKGRGRLKAKPPLALFTL